MHKSLIGQRLIGQRLTGKRPTGKRLTGKRLIVLFSGLVAAYAWSIEPETVGTSTLAPPGETWVMARDGLGSMYIFDTASGEMQGLLGVSRFTPAVEINLEAQEMYAAESFYSRSTRGTRTDVLTIYDTLTLSPKAEIALPAKIAALPFRRYIALLDDDRHVAIFNMTPAQSVSIVDLASRRFVTELSTPGCALTMPSKARSFLQLCGDGRLQLIRLDEQGSETARERSREFFDIEEDPVFDKPVPTRTGWLLMSYGGQLFEVEVENDDIEVSKAWTFIEQAEDAGPWRPGGGQFITYHMDFDLIFVLMNNDGGYSHDSAGSEVWILNRSRRQLITRLELPEKGTNVFVSQNDAPLLTVTGEDQQLHVFDVATLKQVRTISQVGIAPGYLQGVTH